MIERKVTGELKWFGVVNASESYLLDPNGSWLVTHQPGSVRSAGFMEYKAFHIIFKGRFVEFFFLVEGLAIVLNMMVQTLRVEIVIPPIKYPAPILKV